MSVLSPPARSSLVLTDTESALDAGIDGRVEALSVKDHDATETTALGVCLPVQKRKGELERLERHSNQEAHRLGTGRLGIVVANHLTFRRVEQEGRLGALVKVARKAVDAGRAGRIENLAPASRVSTVPIPRARRDSHPPPPAP